MGYCKERCMLLAVGLVVVLSGCASFREGKLPDITQWPPAGGAKGKSITVVFTGQAISTDVNKANPHGWYENAIAQAYRDSKLFSEVKTGAAGGDLLAEVKLIHRGEANLLMAVLTGLTLYLIPSSGTDEFTFRTAIKDKQGTVIGMVEKTEAINFWQQMFLIFVYPFKNPNTVFTDTISDLNRATVIEANAKGYFN